MRRARIPNSLAFSTLAVLLAAGCATSPEGAGPPAAGAPAGGETEGEADDAEARPQAGAPPAAQAGEEMPHRCPMAVPGAEATLEEAEAGGVTLRFVTDQPDAVPELQDRVAAVAGMMERQGIRRLAQLHEGGDPGRPAGWAAVGREAAQDDVEEGEDVAEPIESEPYAATQGEVQGTDEGDDRRMGQENLARHEALMVPEGGLHESDEPPIDVATRVEKTAEGVRLTLTPASPEDAEALAREMRWRVSMMNAGQCPMEHDGAHQGGMPHGEAQHGEGHECAGDCPHHQDG